MRKDQGRFMSKYTLSNSELKILGGDALVWEELLKAGRFDRFDPPSEITMRLRNGSWLAKELDNAATKEYISL